ncbi:MAG TPA: thioredoxin family protein [Bacteroidetes bacterium]|nr:thioredoxin family protein [Bacteroidota bacterium]
MALLQSSMAPLGSSIPSFRLMDVVSQQVLSKDDLMASHGLVVAFICAHCPYVLHLDEHMAKAFNQRIGSGMGFVVISSNDVVNYPQDHPDRLKEQALQRSFQFPYLYDEDQAVAQAFGAVCTPDFFMYDKDGLLVYRGRYDGSNHKNDEHLDGQDLLTAIDTHLENKVVDANQLPSAGCSIKWKNNL